MDESFNSLFEMPHGRRPGAGNAGDAALSILYLRCAASDLRAIISATTQQSFNSLFEMHEAVAEAEGGSTDESFQFSI